MSGVLSAKDRIRAMAALDEAEEATTNMQGDQSSTPKSLQTDSPTKQRNSVIDIWRQREKSALKSSDLAMTPTKHSRLFDKQDCDHLEEKKEEKMNHDSKMDSPPARLQSTPRSTLNSTVFTTPSPTDSRQRAVVTPRASSLHNPDSKVEAENSSTEKQANNTVLVTPESLDSAPPPDFRDLKSRWATFGANKVQAREEATPPSKRQIDPASSKLYHPLASTSMAREASASKELLEENFVTGANVVSPQIPTELQQPVFEPVPPIHSRISHPKRAKPGWSKPRHSRKVATKMVVKDRSLPVNLIASKGFTNQCSDSAPSRAGRLDQRKLILSNVRRRRKQVEANSPSESKGSIDSVPSTKVDTKGVCQEALASVAEDDGGDNFESAAGMHVPEHAVVSPLVDREENVGGKDKDVATLNHESFLNAITLCEDDQNTKLSLMPSHSENVPISQKKVHATVVHSNEIPSMGVSASPTSFDNDEMAMLEKEQRDLHRLPISHHYNTSREQFRPISPDTMSESTASHMVSTITGFSETATKQSVSTSSPTIVADKFVVESSSNVEAFKATFQNMSISDLASDITNEASMAIQIMDLTKMSSGLSIASESIGKNITAAARSLNQIVTANTCKKQIQARRREPSPVEEVAIEVEYVEDNIF